MPHPHIIRISTAGRRDMRDITAEVAAVVEKSGVKAGTVNAFMHLACDVKPRRREIVVTIQGD